MQVGIDRLSFYTSSFYLDLADLAHARGIDVNKFYVGLGQEKMAVPAPDEDIVTLAANAARQALQGEDVSKIDTLLFATESGIDQSKAAGIYVKQLLGLPDRMRVIELKQACYSATAALQMGCQLVKASPQNKVLIVASDISRYGLNTSGESSQGCGAVAMLITANPRILAIEPGAGLFTSDVMDFWRPNYRDEALVEGHYSTEIYLEALQKTWKDYQVQTSRSFEDHAYFCFHNPVPRLVEKAQQQLREINQLPGLEKIELQRQMLPALYYGKQSGNSYSAALYVSLASLLDQAPQNLSGQRIGFYSYGSGCVAEFFSGVVQAGYQQAIDNEFHANMLQSRKRLSYEEYERFYSYHLPQNGGECKTPVHQTSLYRLAGIKEHKRQYETLSEQAHTSIHVEMSNAERIHVRSPGKLILSGEHAVVYGRPALAMAINRYAEAIIQPQDSDQVSFNLLNLNYKDSFTIKTLREVKHQLKDKYKAFLQGGLKIRDVLQAPFQLTHFAVGSWMEHMNAKLQPGMDIKTHSDIPVGCGMGSSAASALSLLQAMAALQKVNLSKEQLFKLALEVEEMQHGTTSGLDLHISLHGGCVYFKQGMAESRPVPKFNFYVVNTGTPSVSTGECVSYVRQHHGTSPIWQTFETVTHIFDKAMQANDEIEVKAAIRDNHQLLTQIGVVPDKVQKFVAQLEEHGAAAKICGAGAIAGDNAGAVLLLADDANILSVENICKQYQYELTRVEAESRGLHLA